MKRTWLVLLTFLAVSFCTGSARALNCSGLPTSFNDDEFPTGDFFSNFNNPCYWIPFALGSGNSLAGDLNSTYYLFFFKVDPRYQLIILGSYPNARYYSITVYDEHRAYSEYLSDVNIVPLTSQYINPYLPGVVFVPGQQYAGEVNFDGTPGTLEPGCVLPSGYNVDANALDGTQRHTGLDWNSDTGFWQAYPHFDRHVVDTPKHTNPNTAGFLMIRADLDITQPGAGDNPRVILRDVASGCAYPAAYAVDTLQVVSNKPGIGGPWLSQIQAKDHLFYADQYLPTLCDAADPENQLPWIRGSNYVSADNPDSAYIEAAVPAGLPAQLASNHHVMRIRVRIPTIPPTPCTDGCSRTGNEQMRYVSLSFLGANQITLASVADKDFTTDVNGYATLVVGTGASVPPWVTPANGYTYLNLAAISGYQNLSGVSMRNVLAAATFSCAGRIVPFRTSVASPAGGLMGDYLPVVDYPLAAELPKTAAPLVGPNACDVFPNGQPKSLPQCGIQPSPPIQIVSANTQCQGPGCKSIVAQSNPPLTINGSGFGSFPDGLPFTGDSNYLQITDTTQNWDAGYGSDQCTVSISDWSLTTISLVVNGACPLVGGDQLTINVWNPQAMGSPATFSATVAK